MGWAPITGLDARWKGTPGHWPVFPSCPPSGLRASGRGAGPPQRPPRSCPCRLLAWHQRGGEGGGAASAWGSCPGQQLMVSGQRVSGAPFRASVAPSASLTGGCTCPPAVRTAGGVGGALRIGGAGPAGGVSRAVRLLPSPHVRRLASRARPARSQTIAAGRGPHLRRRMLRGWGCGGGGFLGRCASG